VYQGITLLAVVAGAITAVNWFSRSAREPDCVTASRTESSDRAVQICQREYQRTKLPATGALLAQALMRGGDRKTAGTLANVLLMTDAQADAFQILGRIDLDANRNEDATVKLEKARSLHRAGPDYVGLAEDGYYLAYLQIEQHQYIEAIKILDESLAAARLGNSAHTEGRCHLYMARALIGAGYFEGGQQALDRAALQLESEQDQASLWFERGKLEQEIDRIPPHRTHQAIAVAAFERSLALAKRAGDVAHVIANHLHLAYSLAELGQTTKAEQHLEAANNLDSKRTEDDRVQLAARIAYRSSDFGRAISLNDQIYPKLTDEDDQIDVSVMQARIALATNQVELAVHWATKGVESAQKIRAGQKSNELQPWVLASRREPFEVLFVGLVRAGWIADAFAVFDQWQSRSLLDAMARPSSDSAPEPSSTARKLQGTERWLSTVSNTPLMKGDKAAAMQTLAMIDLVAFAVAEGEVWRLTDHHGHLHIEDLGTMDTLRGEVDAFMTSPTDPAAARALGARLLPDDLVHGSDPLYVVLDAPLAGIPFAALRWNEQPLIAMRPVLRAPRLPVSGTCKLRTETNGALVLGDAFDDLPDARRESLRVAALLGTSPLLGDAATSAALFAGKSDPLLHIAVHTGLDAGGGTLRLYDRSVSAPEISANKLGPSLVVLAACSTASSQDPELARSLSTAFLAAGSDRVVATLRPISDVGARELTTRFYADHGVVDPVSTLAKIQATLADSDNKDWPNFAVFGSKVCGPS
jgi:tetratricopeptide (TPR) repeat protein